MAGLSNNRDKPAIGMAARELQHNPTEDVMSYILKVSIIGATAICVSFGLHS